MGSFTPPTYIVVEVEGAATAGVDERVLPFELGIPDLRMTVPLSHAEAPDFDIFATVMSRLWTASESVSRYES